MNNEIFRQHDEIKKVKDDADHTIICLHNEVADLKDTVHKLENSQTLHHRKLPHCESHSPFCSCSYHASSHTLHPDSLVMMDHDPSLLPLSMPPPYLLLRLSRNLLAIASTLSQLVTILASLPPIGPPPTPGTNLTTCLGDNINIAPVALAIFTPALVGTNFNHIISFYAMHPVLAFANGQYTCECTDAQGNIDLSNNAHFIYALRHYPPNSMQFWTTSLVTHLSLTFGCIINTIQSCIPLPHAFVNWGGRDSLLISSTDPTTEEVLEEWFTMPDKSKLASYAK
jgi:hypothetical protein